MAHIETRVHKVDSNNIKNAQRPPFGCRLGRDTCHAERLALSIFRSQAWRASHSEPSYNHRHEKYTFWAAGAKRRLN